MVSSLKPKYFDIYDHLGTAFWTASVLVIAS